MTSRQSALRLPGFRRIAVAYSVNELGNAVGDVALAILVFDRTGSPLATTALFVSLRAFPAMLAPLLTTRVEIVPVKRALPLLYLTEGIIFAAIAVLAHSFSLPAVLVLSAVDGILAVTARALMRAANATLLGKAGLLREGNAIITMGVTIGNALGPAIAGVLVASAGAGAALVIDALSFGVAAAVLIGAQGLQIDSDAAAGTVGRLRAGLREAWTRPTTRRLLIGAGAAMMFATVVIPIEVVFVKRTLHAGDSGYGVLIASWGIGMVAGGGAFAMAGRLRLDHVISAGVGLIAAGYAGLAVSPNLIVACMFSVVGGIGNSIWATSVVTGLQESVAPTARSAVMALLGSIYQVAPALGFAAGGAITAISSPRIAYAVAAAGVGAVLLVMGARPLDVPVPQLSSQDAP